MLKLVRLVHLCHFTAWRRKGCFLVGQGTHTTVVLCLLTSENTRPLLATKHLSLEPTSETVRTRNHSPKASFDSHCCEVYWTEIVLIWVFSAPGRVGGRSFHAKPHWCNSLAPYTPRPTFRTPNHPTISPLHADELIRA